MAIDVSSVQTFTDAELLKLWRNCLAAIATGQSYSIGGRTLTRADLKEAREMVDWLENRINAASDNGGIALADFGNGSN